MRNLYISDHDLVGISGGSAGQVTKQPRKVFGGSGGGRGSNVRKTGFVDGGNGFVVGHAGGRGGSGNLNLKTTAAALKNYAVA